MLQSKKKVEITTSALAEINVKSGSYFDHMLTVLLTMKIYNDFDYTEYIVTMFQSTWVAEVTTLNVIKITMLWDGLHQKIAALSYLVHM